MVKDGGWWLMMVDDMMLTMVAKMMDHVAVMVKDYQFTCSGVTIDHQRQS